MSASKIEWVNRIRPDGSTVQGFTMNPWIGCAKVSPACDNCYAERDAGLRRQMVSWGTERDGGTRRVTVGDYWSKIEAAARKAWKAGPDRPLVFCASWADVMEEWRGPLLDQHGRVLRVVHEHGMRPTGSGWMAGSEFDGFRPVTMDDARARLFRLIARTSYSLDWLILTKRPVSMAFRWRELMAVYNAELDTLNATDARYQHVVDARNRLDSLNQVAPNIWGGVTVEDAEHCARRVRRLQDIPLARRFVSAEPLVGSVAEALKPALSWTQDAGSDGIHWVIAGGESGDKARPHDPAWFRDLRDDSHEAGVPFLFKQWGEWAPVPDEKADHLNDTFFKDSGEWVRRYGRENTGRMLDGRVHHGIPESVLVQPWSVKDGMPEVQRRDASRAP